MATDRLHLNPRAVHPRTLVLLFLLAIAVSPEAAGAYGWPVKPFHQQHPVRGFFGDPRMHKGEHALHFGVDVSAPDGTLVYATVSGRVAVNYPQPEVVSVQLQDGSSLEYWHVVPLVRAGTFATAYKTPLGRIGAGWGHVHVAEIRGGRYVNPLRPEGLRPYVDRTRPEVRHISLERDGKAFGRTATSGRLDLVAEALDTTPLAPPAPWDGKPVSPALVRWRLVGETGWTTAVDFRAALPSSFDGVYAKWTRPNHPGSRGRYRFVLAHDFDTRRLADGRHELEVVALDSRGNVGRLRRTFTVDNRAQV
jgi:hypothetical protein